MDDVIRGNGAFAEEFSKFVAKRLVREELMSQLKEEMQEFFRQFLEEGRTPDLVHSVVFSAFQDFLSQPDLPLDDFLFEAFYVEYRYEKLCMICGSTGIIPLHPNLAEKAEEIGILRCFCPAGRPVPATNHHLSHD